MELPRRRHWTDANYHVLLREGGNCVDVSLIYRIAGIGILITILNIFLRQAGREEQAQMLSLAGVIIVLLSLLSLIVELFSEVEKAFWW